jgi:hypothetical protein
MSADGRAHKPDPEFLQQLKDARCLEETDIVRDKEMTKFKQRARLKQAEWRQQEGFGIGAAGGRQIGSMLESEAAKRDLQNFLTDRTKAAVEHRVKNREKYQQINRTRLYTNMLSSMPMCFNLFGELWENPESAAVAVSKWFPDMECQRAKLLFEWSPGRRDERYLNNGSAFDAAFLLDLSDGSRGVVGIETKYHEHPKEEKLPGDDRLPLYEIVAEDSGRFKAEWREAVLGTNLQQIWLDHLLVLSMVRSKQWESGKFVLVYPSGNVAFRNLADAYCRILEDDDSTFEHTTIEKLLDADVLPAEAATQFRARYLWTID